MHIVENKKEANFKVVDIITGDKYSGLKTESQVIRVINGILTKKIGCIDRSRYGYGGESIDSALHCICGSKKDSTCMVYRMYVSNTGRISSASHVGDFSESRANDYIARMSVYITVDGYKVIRRFAVVTDEYDRIITVNKFKTIYFNAHTLQYETKKEFISKERVYNRKKKLREKDSGFRKEPVRYTCKRKGGSCYRRISYKSTLINYTDIECTEYGVKGYRKRRVLDAWDIEPYEKGSRSWKENNKVIKQYMVHS